MKHDRDLEKTRRAFRKALYRKLSGWRVDVLDEENPDFWLLLAERNGRWVGMTFAVGLARGIDSSNMQTLAGEVAEEIRTDWVKTPKPKDPLLAGMARWWSQAAILIAKIMSRLPYKWAALHWHHVNDKKRDIPWLEKLDCGWNVSNAEQAEELCRIVFEAAWKVMDQIATILPETPPPDRVHEGAQETKDDGETTVLEAGGQAACAPEGDATDRGESSSGD